MPLKDPIVAAPVRALLIFWFVASLAWVILIAGFVHSRTLLQNPVYMAEDFRWQFQDCLSLSHAPNASPADLMVARVLCSRAHRSGLRRHLGELIIPPAAGLFMILAFRWIGRRWRLF